MSQPKIAFQDGYRFERVTAVLIPVDATTRRPVTSGVRAWLWDQDADESLPFKLVRNLSGHFVLRNQPTDAVYDFRLDPSGARYRQPVDVSFNPKTDGISLVVPLERRPDYPFEDGSTLIRGKVEQRDGDHRAGAPDVVVSVLPGPGLGDTQVAATTDDRGSFVVMVRPMTEVSDTSPPPLEVTLRFEQDGGPTRDLPVTVDRSQTHIFSKPINIDGNNVPPFHPEEQGADEQ